MEKGVATVIGNLN